MSASTSAHLRPQPTRIVVRPALATVLLHALVLYLMTAHWVQPEPKSVRVEPAARAIQARLVDASALQPKPKPRARPKAKTTARPHAKKKAAAKPVHRKKPVPAPAPSRVEPRKEPRTEPKPRITQEELAEAARLDLARAVQSEEQVAATSTAEEMVASYAALIRDTVVNYWSRPPSARNGMEALLSIQLVPTGDVVSVSVIRSSGSAAFDRSAVNAVQKAGRFPELRNLASADFEKTFRRFRLLFRPEDLRY